MKQHFCLDISIVLLLALFQTSAFAERLELRLLVWEGYAPEAVVKKFERVLGISLMVESKPEETKRIVSDGSRKMTLGDYFKQNGA